LAKGIFSAILGGRHIGFNLTGFTLSFYTRQALSFDTHINRVVKKKVIRHLNAAAILSTYITIFSKLIKPYFIVTKIKDLCKILD